jgi:lipid-A-disaccharide synthase
MNMVESAEVDEKLLMIIAGEASGDMYGSYLARELLQYGNIRLVGMGGAKMAAAGVELAYPLANMATVGVSGVLRNLSTFRRVLAQAKDMLSSQPPLALILLDYPGFNVRLAEHAHKLGIPVIYYITPQLWAWNPGRVKKLKQIVDQMLVILPFEPDFYKQYGMNVNFVGHPLMDLVPQQFLGAAKPPGENGDIILGLLPGSRQAEVEYMLPIMMRAAEEISGRVERCRVLLFRAPEISQEQLRFDTTLPVEICESDYQTRSRVHFALTASGTATLENALLGVPMCIIYRTNAINFFLARMLVRIKLIGLVNIISRKEICKEFLQGKATPKAIAQHVSEIMLDQNKWKTMRTGLDQVRISLGTPGASNRAAQAVAETVGCKQL